MPTEERQSQQAFLAAAASLGAAAATHSAAMQRLGFADRDVAMSIEELREAARERRSAQKIAEREAEIRQANYLAATQRELDDVAIGRWGHKRAHG